jgi:hypothetical protein
MIRFPEDVATPVGKTCADCEEPIASGDWGHILTGVPSRLDRLLRRIPLEPIHGECFIREVVGGIEHLTAPAGHARGSCYEGSTLTRRQSALAAFAWLRATGDGRIHGA